MLTSPDGFLALHARAEVAALTDAPVRVLLGGTAAWQNAGQPLESHPGRYASPAIDVYKRPYEGTNNRPDAMQAYIDWELRLVAQLANDGISNFHVIR